MCQRFWTWLLCGLLIGICGCTLSRPKWLDPGSVGYQQSRASYHDPYADRDAGPVIIGGRPRDFRYPRSEPVRSSAFRDTFGGF